MINELKASFAKEKITEFIALMQQLGFSKEEILSLINTTMKGEQS